MTNPGCSMVGRWNAKRRNKKRSSGHTATQRAQSNETLNSLCSVECHHATIMTGSVPLNCERATRWRERRTQHQRSVFQHMDPIHIDASILRLDDRG
ncbi:hypothetical protein BDP81DRAFT_223143 [Colletotrichum phormii]|uniref:Uncharacterized protein n=1 Tax=Colletotrichum phormii TaxID=359342 RepID=A0AAI9ZV21_9PEZI|nr:uncharacterized protein BDP81DRAFT_223143 [Colletotrichum phormii]KAK1637379.1 hypothetical protein BDP81DRAFT_223143 [Colletotrichum phormii]